MTVIAAGLVTSNNQYCFIEPSFSTDPVDTLLADFQVVRGDNAAVALDTGTEKHGFQCMYGFIVKNHTEQRNLANFFCIGPNPRIGKVRSFWMPSWISDFQLAQDINNASDTVFQVKVPLYFDKMFEAERYGFQIELLNKDLVINKIHAYNENNGQITVAPTTTIGKVIKKTDVARLSLVRRVRFDQNRLGYKYKSDSVAEISGQVIEVFGEAAFA